MKLIIIGPLKTLRTGKFNDEVIMSNQLSLLTLCSVKDQNGELKKASQVRTYSDEYIRKRENKKRFMAALYMAKQKLSQTRIFDEGLIRY